MNQTVYDEVSALKLLRDSNVGDCFKVASKKGEICLAKIDDVTQHLNNISYLIDGGGWNLCVTKTFGGNYAAEVFFSSRHVAHRAQGTSVIDALVKLNMRISNVIQIARTT